MLVLYPNRFCLYPDWLFNPNWMLIPIGFFIPIDIKRTHTHTPTLFRLCIAHKFQSLTQRWINTKWGYALNDGNLIPTTIYADDIILLAHKKHHLKHMINDVQHCLNKMGLNISTTKTTIATNNPGWHNHHLDTTTGTITINGPETHLTVLGTKLSMTGSMTAELQHRRR